MVMTGLFNHWTDQFKVFSCFLAMSEVDFWCIYTWRGKHVENVTNHNEVQGMRANHKLTTVAVCGLGFSHLIGLLFSTQ